MLTHYFPFMCVVSQITEIRTVFRKARLLVSGLILIEQIAKIVNWTFL